MSNVPASEVHPISLPRQFSCQQSTRATRPCCLSCSPASRLLSFRRSTTPNAKQDSISVLLQLSTHTSQEAMLQEAMFQELSKGGANLWSRTRRGSGAPASDNLIYHYRVRVALMTRYHAFPGWLHLAPLFGLGPILLLNCACFTPSSRIFDHGGVAAAAAQGRARC